MNPVNRFRLTALVLASLLSGCASLPSPEPVTGQKELVVILVRHAEKIDSSADPALSAAGIERAARLAAVLRSARIEMVHSSNFIRTRDTAGPTAGAFGLRLQLYDPRDLHALADYLRQTGGRHLVVGHSNTTPAMVELLGGDPGPEIDETGEYDRLYIVTVGMDGRPNSALLRYGDLYSPDQHSFVGP